MITEDYVSFETAKLLKEKGFKMWCYKCYGTAVCHKGVPISFDEECDLESEGLGDEIEYIEGGRLYNSGCDNTEEETNIWAAPTLWTTMKWLRNKHDIVCSVGLFTDLPEMPPYWSFNILNRSTANVIYEAFDIKCGTYEDACEAAIKYCLEHLI